MKTTTILAVPAPAFDLLADSPRALPTINAKRSHPFPRHRRLAKPHPSPRPTNAWHAHSHNLFERQFHAVAAAPMTPASVVADTKGRSRWPGHQM